MRIFAHAIATALRRSLSSLEKNVTFVSQLVLAELNRHEHDKQPTRRIAGIAAVQALLTRFGIAREELLFEGAGTSHRVVNTDALNAGRTRPVRYLGPNGERWAGCGRTPAWVIEIESRGGCREHYRVA